MKKYYKKVKGVLEQKDFDQIKLLQGKNFKTREVRQLLGWGGSTIGHIYQSNSLQEYKERSSPSTRLVKPIATNGETKKAEKPTYPELGSKLDKIASLLEQTNELLSKRKIW